MIPLESEESTILDVKAMLEVKGGYPVEVQTLFYNAKRLNMVYLRMKDYGIQNESTLTLRVDAVPVTPAGDGEDCEEPSAEQEQPAARTYMVNSLTSTIDRAHIRQAIDAAIKRLQDEEQAELRAAKQRAKEESLRKGRKEAKERQERDTAGILPMCFREAHVRRKLDTDVKSMELLHATANLAEQIEFLQNVKLICPGTLPSPQDALDLENKVLVVHAILLFT